MVVTSYLGLTKTGPTPLTRGKAGKLGKR
jgi:hypothetical protein